MTPKPIQYRILLVDDEVNNRKLIVRLLRPSGYDLREVSNGLEAVEAWKEWNPHVVLMDMRMPVMDGYMATQKIRQLEEENKEENSKSEKIDGLHNQTKIIAITANAFNEERSRIFGAGCDDIIHKPFRLEQLRQSIILHLADLPISSSTLRDR